MDEVGKREDRNLKKDNEWKVVKKKEYWLDQIMPRDKSQGVMK